MLRRCAVNLVFFDTKPTVARKLSDKAVEAMIAPLEKNAWYSKNRGANDKIVADVMDIIRTERERKSYVGRLTYLKAMRVVGKLGDINNALLLLEMRKKDNIQPCSETYDWAIAAFTKRFGSLDSAKKLLSSLRSQGYKMSRKSHTNVIKLYSRNLDFEGANRSAIDMRTAGYELGIDGHNALLLGCQTYEQLSEVSESMRINNVTRNSTSLNMMLRVCLRMKDPANAKKIFNLIKNEGYAITMNHYTIMFSIHAAAKDLRGVSDTYNAMIMSGIPPDTYCYKVLIESLSQWATHPDCEITELSESIVSNGMVGATMQDGDTLRVALMSVYAKAGAINKLNKLISRSHKNRSGIYQNLLQEANENAEKIARDKLLKHD